MTIPEPLGCWKIGTRVTKTKGSSWTGHVVGYYSTSLTPIGYAVESENEPGSVQIYPAGALAVLPARTPAPSQPAPDEVGRLREALTLAANRLDRCVIDYIANGSTDAYRIREWAKEARTALGDQAPDLSV